MTDAPKKPDYERLSRLIDEAHARFEALPPAQQAHQRHLQRISFAYGNVAMSYADRDDTFLKTLRNYVEKSAGPCPCGECL